MSWWNNTSYCFMKLQGLAHPFCLCHTPQRNGLLISNSFRASIRDPLSLTSFVGLFIPQGVFLLFFLIRTFLIHGIHLLIAKCWVSASYGPGMFQLLEMEEDVRQAIPVITEVLFQWVKSTVRNTTKSHVITPIKGKKQNNVMLFVEVFLLPAISSFYCKLASAPICHYIYYSDLKILTN